MAASAPDQGPRSRLRLVLASNNAKKLSELQALLGGLQLDLMPQSQLGITEAEEPHQSFLENALAKARHAAQACQGAALADDSGLSVDALGGAPGVISAHYAGEVTALGERETRRKLQDQANNQRLLADLDQAGSRRACFVCTLVAIRHAQDPQPLVAVGRWQGELLTAPQGDLGFGYDPLMFIPELSMTVAEMPAALKNQHSHRARAMQQLLLQLREVWQL